MLQMNVIPGSNKALIQYPKEVRKPAKEIVVGYSEAHLQRKWESETRDFMYKTLRSWVMQRNRAFIAVKGLTPQLAHTVDRLLLMLINAQDSRLHVLCAKVLELHKEWVLLLPSKESRCHAFTKAVIAPMFLWCQEYIDIYNAHNPKN
ncbi:hypothetical protein GCM10011418_39100 [Sphingobacterium alkalisoli]|nr:hypothetical protein GCM10011418_39100 [Sphingobacterium alkalisoli]